MAKRKRTNGKRQGFPRWADLTGKPTRTKRVFPPRYSASAVRIRGGLDKSLHFDLNRSHIESLGVPDHGQSTIPWNKRGDEQRPGRPHPTHPIPKTYYSKAQLLAQAFVLPRLEVNRLRTQVINNGGELISVPWNHIVLEQDEHTAVYCFWKNDKVFLVEEFKITKSLRFSKEKYKTVKDACQAFLNRGLDRINMGPRKPYVDT